MNIFDIWSKFDVASDDSPQPVKTECLNPIILTPELSGWANRILNLDDRGRFTMPPLLSMTAGEADLYRRVMMCTQLRGRKYSDECVRAVILMVIEYTKGAIMSRELEDGLKAVAIKALSDSTDSFSKLVERMETPNDQMRRLWKDLIYIVRQHIVKSVVFS